MRGPQLNIRGLSDEEIIEFDNARKGIGPEGSNVSRKIFIKMLLRKWKESTAQQRTEQSAGGAGATRSAALGSGRIGAIPPAQSPGKAKRTPKARGA